ncbi:MAG: 6-bladed beta-propeller [Tannerella sp.]|jgi:hypothetical protein|nr:6-bladed beta-propeller [Tannerella sp.]
MKQIICLLLIVSYCVSCSQPQRENNTIYVNLDRPEKASLGDYFRSVELIPLETDSNVLMKSIYRTIYYQSKYYVLDMPQAIVFVFGQQGNFIFKIDNRGQGPGQYYSIEDIHINPFSGHLELLSWSGFVYDYDLSGNYLETRRLVYDGLAAVHHLIAIDSTTHVFYSRSQPEKIIYYNLDEKKLLHEEFEEQREIGSYAYDSFYPNKDGWYFFRPFHTIVYKIGMEHLEPAFRFDFGKYTKEGLTGNFNFIKAPPRTREDLADRAFSQFSYLIEKVGQNDSYVLAQLSWKELDNYANIIYDKSTGTSKFIPKFEEKVIFKPNIVTDEYVLGWCDWVDLEKYVPQSLLDDSSKKVYESLLASEMETNPVLIKYYFK